MIEIQERTDQRQLEQSLSKLPQLSRSIILQNIIEQVSWHGPIDREWLEQEVAGELKRKGLE